MGILGAWVSIHRSGLTNLILNGLRLELEAATVREVVVKMLDAYASMSKSGGEREICLEPITVSGGIVVPVVNSMGRHRFDLVRGKADGSPHDVKADDDEGNGDAEVPLSVSGIIIPETTVASGVIIKSIGLAWSVVAQRLVSNWNVAYEIPPHKWEEMIAGAFDKAGYDQVILTPRSGDFGRDVIAIKKGVGCIKIIGSVKAYKPGNLVRHDDVRALLGVLSGEPDASKGIVTTTSDFAPRIKADPFIKPFLPTRLELMNGAQLREWLDTLTK